MPDIPDDTTLSQSAVHASFITIGPYRLIQMLGIGGMGEVWRAEQTEPLHRTVALKLIKAGMDTKSVVARFDSERQTLALMDHPNIAKVFDAGATPEGRPYFVMEFVPGLPITDYCDKRRLTIKERLRLFMQVCDGVQHAHQKAIIHRDLKPSNVLVEEVDDKPVPKIIDFGLAKATGQRLTGMTMFSEAGAIVGTPDYMSPEQADRKSSARRASKPCCRKSPSRSRSAPARNSSRWAIPQKNRQESAARNPSRSNVICAANSIGSPSRHWRRIAPGATVRLPILPPTSSATSTISPCWPGPPAPAIAPANSSGGIASEAA